jgi:transposase
MKKNSKAEEKKEQNQNTQTKEPGKILKMEAQQLLRKMTGNESCKSKGAKNERAFFIGIDIGDKNSRYCLIDAGGEIMVEDSMATTQEAFTAYFVSMPKTTIAIEVGSHSPWISELLESCGHRVYVANPRRMESIHKNRRKNDKVDARTLARLVRADPELLYPIHHRSAGVREDLVLLRAREAMVSVRTSLINSVRGLVKSVGGRLPACSAHSFHNKAVGSIPERLRTVLLPMIEQIQSLTEKLRDYDKEAESMASKKYPEVY